VGKFERGLLVVKTTLLVLVVAVCAFGCKGQESSPDSGAIDPAAAKSTVKPNAAAGAGAGSMNAKNMTPGPGANKSTFGAKSGGN
jgi:hypothetical protein